MVVQRVDERPEDEDDEVEEDEEDEEDEEQEAKNNAIVVTLDTIAGMLVWRLFTSDSTSIFW